MEHLGLIQPAPIFRRSRKRRKLNLSQDPNQVADPVHGALNLINNPNAAYTNLGGYSSAGGDQGAPWNSNWEGNSDDEDDYDDTEDTKGVDALIEWFKGPVAAEIRRVAGVMPGPAMAPATAATATASAEAGPSTANGGAQAQAAPGAPIVNTSVGGLATAMVGTGIPPPAGGQTAVEAGPVTWLDGESTRGGG